MAVWSEVEVAELGPVDRIDAEYYDPELLRLQDELAASGLKIKAFGDLVLDGYRVVYENTQIVDAPDSPDHVRFLQATNVWGRLPVINQFGIGWVSRTDWLRYPKGRIKPGELLIEVKGKAEKVAVVPADFPSETLVTGTLFKATVDEEQVVPGYLVAYLLSKYGRGLRTRCLTNTLIGYVSKPELYAIPVPLADRETQQRVSDRLNDCLSEERESRRLYAEAERLLLRTLPSGATATHGAELTYEAPYTQIASADRLDAEFYQPEKWTVLAALGKASGGSLRDYFTQVRSLWDPTRAQEAAVRSFDLADAFFPFLDDTKDICPPQDVGSVKKMFAPGDLVISRLRSYLRQVAISQVSPDVPAVGSSEFIVLRPQEHALVASETLLLYLRSAPVQTILQWSQDGSNHPRFDPNVLMDLPIPDAVVDSGSALAQLVRESIDRLRAAELALVQATRLVERVVLDGVTGDDVTT